MKLKLIAHIENFGDAGYIGYVDSIRGMVVQGSTLKEAWEELLISLKVKISHDFGIDMAAFEEKEMFSIEKSTPPVEFERNGKKELSLTLA